MSVKLEENASECLIVDDRGGGGFPEMCLIVLNILIENVSDA
jgi:hypothetical protein